MLLRVLLIAASMTGLGMLIHCCLEDLRGKKYSNYRQKHRGWKKFFLFMAGMLLLNVPWITLIKTNRVDKEDNTYAENSDIATQHTIDELFDTDTDDCREEKHKQWKSKENLQSLRIEDKFLGKSVTEGMIDHYYAVDKPYYKYGKKNPFHNKKNWVNERLNNKDTSEDTASENEYEKESERWIKLYDDTERPESLYQAYRSKRESLEHSTNMEFSIQLSRAEETITMGERFLSYENRKISNNGVTKDIRTVDIAIGNGRSYIRLATACEADEDYQSYKSTFLVKAYVCFLIALGSIDREDPEYALVCYNIGNILEKILPYIDKDDIFYHTVLNDAENEYLEAQGSLRINSDYYIKETNMARNIELGLATVKSMIKDIQNR